MSVIQKIQIKLTSRYGRMPTRGSECSAGYDLHAAQDILIPPKGKALIKTNLQIALPAGTYGRIAPRSGLALKHGIDVGGGVVDADYRGDVAVVLFNLGEENFQISVGDKVAQLICQVIQTPVLVEVEELPSTIRGNHGFGSTDISDREYVYLYIDCFPRFS